MIKLRHVLKHNRKITPFVWMEENGIKIDLCVCCGCDTGILTDTPIKLRPHYIQGTGQLCQICYEELYLN